MAKTPATVTLNNNRFKLMHRSVGKKFSIRIDLIAGSPPDSLPGVSVLMDKMIGGVIPTLAHATNFQFMPGAQCIPVGSIRAELQGLDSALVNYTINTGSDA
jgi:hypothetical protein